jgi:hypothetical protein
VRACAYVNVRSKNNCSISLTLMELFGCREGLAVFALCPVLGIAALTVSAKSFRPCYLAVAWNDLALKRRDWSEVHCHRLSSRPPGPRRIGLLEPHLLRHSSTSFVFCLSDACSVAVGAKTRWHNENELLQIALRSAFESR